MSKVIIEEIEFRGWKNCVHMSNGIIELIATTEVGPRIISFGFIGGPNEFAVFDEQAGMVGGMNGEFMEVIASGIARRKRLGLTALIILL